MHDAPKFITHTHDPVYDGTPPLIFRDRNAAQQERLEQKKISQAASSEAVQREAALLRALNPPRMPTLEPPRLRAPVLSDDFAEQAKSLDEKIFNRGVAIDRDRLVSLGKERFAELLALDRTARLLQRVLILDFSSWLSVLFGFAATSPLVAAVPRRRTADVVAGRGLDREAVSKIESFHDLWKATTAHAPTIHNVLRFHNAFATLAFGQSLLTRLSSDNRMRSHLFCGGRGRKVELFDLWLGALDGAHVKITIDQPIFSVLAWLCKEQTQRVDATELARAWFNVRSPAQTQLALAEAIFEGFLFGKTSWHLWEHVGNAARAAVDHDTLEVWRKDLARVLPAVSGFHDAMRSYFFREVSSYGHGHHEFDSLAYHSFIERAVHKLVDCASMLAAQTVEETGVCVARFADGWLLCEGKPSSRLALIDKISAKLAAAFRGGATFSIMIKEVCP